MATIYVKNSGKNPLPCAGRMIQPGEGIHMEEREVPPHLRPNAPAPKPAKQQDPEDALLEILDHNVKEIVEMLPALDDEELASLKDAEENGKTRKSLMTAFAEEELRRANERADGGTGDDTREGDDNGVDSEDDTDQSGGDGSGADGGGTEEPPASE